MTVLLLVVTLAITIISLWGDARSMDPLEHYAWRGWYQIAFFGLPVTGVLVVLWLLLCAAWRMLRRGFQALTRIIHHSRDKAAPDPEMRKMLAPGGVDTVDTVDEVD